MEEQQLDPMQAAVIKALKGKEPGMLEKAGIGTPEMQGIGMGLQVLDQYLQAPYQKMAAEQAMAQNRIDKQQAGLANLQNISKMYGNL